MEFLFRHFELILGVVLAMTGFIVGRMNERRHYASTDHAGQPEQNTYGLYLAYASDAE